MSPADRAAAKATAARAEALAETLYRASQAVQATFQAVGRGAQFLARRLRARFA